MWKKGEDNEGPTGTTPPVPPQGGRRDEVRRGGERATIGPSITIQGDVRGEEDLYIQGRVEGKVDLTEHNVTVGPEGRVKADIYGRTVTVEGEVEGNLFGGEQLVLRRTARVVGNIVSPRVTLEDGASFKGSIDMDVATETRPGRAGAARREVTAPSEGTDTTAAVSAGEAPKPGEGQGTAGGA